MARHPEHDAVAAEVRGWFRTSAPEIGYFVEPRPFGVVSSLGPAVRLILDVEAAEEVAPALAEVAAARVVTIWVDDRERDRRLAGALEAAGCTRTTATTHLALVGHVSARPAPAGLTIEQLGLERMAEWATVKLQSFGDSEDDPPAERVAAEAELRRSEAALAVHLLVRLGGEAVGVLAYYVGADQLVFNLGTRLPYRHRGIAQAALASWAASCEAAGCRSAMINAHEGGRPEALYRRLGFVDEVYWYQAYQLRPAR